jgi:hypothetical protein
MDQTKVYKRQLTREHVSKFSFSFKLKLIESNHTERKVQTLGIISFTLCTS